MFLAVLGGSTMNKGKRYIKVYFVCFTWYIPTSQLVAKTNNFSPKRITFWKHNSPKTANSHKKFSLSIYKRGWKCTNKKKTLLSHPPYRLKNALVFFYQKDKQNHRAIFVTPKRRPLIFVCLYRRILFGWCAELGICSQISKNVIISR